MNGFPGATGLTLLLAMLLSVAVFFVLARRGSAGRTPLVLGIACMGWFVPLVVFLLSNPPANLPLFAIRHVLPATVLLTLLCAYGVELLATTAERTRLTAADGGRGLPFAPAGCMPFLRLLHAGTARYPYDQVGQMVAAQQRSGTPAYTVWYYGIGEPVNFYCRYACVQKLPGSDAALPSRFIFLYRPFAKDETVVYHRLLRDGYMDDEHTDFADGLQTPYGPRAALLERRRR